MQAGSGAAALAPFRGHVDLLVQSAQRDPYVKNFIFSTDPRMLSYIPAISFSGNEKNPLFHNLGDGTFEEIGSVTGLSRVEDGRGFVLADLDRDGDMDVVLHNYRKNPLVALRNDVREGASTLTIRLRGAKSNRFGIGARVTVDGRLQEMTCGSGFLSGNPPELVFAVEKSSQLVVRWPGGATQAFDDIPARRMVTIAEGESTPKIEELRPVALGRPPADPLPPLREGDVWPIEGTGPGVVVLWSLRCHVCADEIREWKESGTKGSVTWMNVDGNLDRARALFIKLGIPQDPVCPSEADLARVSPEGTPAVFAIDKTGKIQAKFVGVGSVRAAVAFAEGR